MGLKHLSILLLSGILSLLFQGCSTTNWTVVNENAVDVNDYELTSTRYFLESTNGLHPAQPIVHFDLKSKNTYEYALRVRTERYIQRYRPRLGYVLLGLAGAGLSGYAAFSDQLISRPTDLQRYSLIGAGSLLTGLSFLNMKPVGEPTRTGESRLLRKTGSTQETDTTNARPYNNEKPYVRISYKNEVLTDSLEVDFTSGRISFNIAEEIDAGVFEETPSQKIIVEAFYDSLKTSKEVKVSDVLEQFVVVDVQISALRNEAAVNPNNVLTDLAEGSQLKLVSKEGDWYKVLYGITETWVAAKDVRTIWRPSEFASALSVIAIPNVPFGSVDVERDIPVLGMPSLNYSAFIISNSQFEGDISERIYGQRDAKLMEEYFIQGIGVRSAQIVKANNISTDQLLERAYSRLATSISDTSHNLLVYINGYAETRNSKVYLLGSEEREGELQYIDMHQLFRAIKNLNLSSVLVFADFDFINEEGSVQPLEELAAILTEDNSNTAVLFSSRPDQRSGIYSSSGNGTQNRHSIFTYYLAQALKERNMTISSIYDHLNRNVTFTSRSLYDRPQTPLLFGNLELGILN